MNKPLNRDYNYYETIFKQERMPLAYVDLELFDANVAALLKRSGDKLIRIASKSVRCKSLLRRLLSAHPQIQGIMCFSAEEAVWLSKEGFDDLLVAYPCLHPAHIKAVAQEVKKGKKIYLMVDLPEHLELMDKIGQEEAVKIPLCLDLDMSSKFPGIHFGVFRSSVNDISTAKAFLEKAKACQHIELKALMGYEAQIAGLNDNIKGKALMNRVISFLKSRSIKEISKRREAVVKLMQDMGFNLELVNGGGTGSLESTSSEPWVTEVTVGSGFYASTLFDGYKNFKHLPSAGFAIQVVRNPVKDIYTCLGGGYVASGAIGKEKAPLPYLPSDCKLLENEMAGEVQTPVECKSGQIGLGSPVLFRHSKAGELCEHFNDLLLIEHGKVESRVLTYRGEGKSFL